MNADERLVEQLIGELRRTNERMDDLSGDLKDVVLNRHRIEVVEKDVKALRERIEGEGGISDKIAVLVDASATSRKGMVAWIGVFGVALAGVLNLLVELFRAALQKVGMGS